MLDGWALSRWLRMSWSAGCCLLCDAPGGAVPNLCQACREALPEPPCLDPDRVVALAYRPPVTHLVHGMKYQGSLAAARTLGELLAATVLEALTRSGTSPPDAIVPVPLHARRLWERGFNQSLELARPLARRLGVPLLARACQRVRATPPQADILTPAARRRNVAGAFRVHPRAARSLGRIALVDDVLTTGATVRELAATLRGAGAKRVMVWACCGRPG